MVATESGLWYDQPITNEQSREHMRLSRMSKKKRIEQGKEERYQFLDFLYTANDCLYSCEQYFTNDAFYRRCDWIGMQAHYFGIGAELDTLSHINIVPSEISLVPHRVVIGNGKETYYIPKVNITFRPNGHYLIYIIGKKLGAFNALRAGHGKYRSMFLGATPIELQNPPMTIWSQPIYWEFEPKPIDGEAVGFDTQGNRLLHYQDLIQSIQRYLSYHFPENNGNLPQQVDQFDAIFRLSKTLWWRGHS